MYIKCKIQSFNNRKQISTEENFKWASESQLSGSPTKLTERNLNFSGELELKKFDYSFNRLEILLQKIIKSISEMTSLYQTNNLSTIYPDISGQLCNKHVKKLSYLKSLFKDIYGGTSIKILEMEPQGYVLVNGVAKVIDLGHDLHLSFALENGVTVLFSKTSLNGEIFINGNQMQQELIFNSKGKHEDGIHQKIGQIKKLLKLIRKAQAQQKEFYGGIIYVYSNIGENLFGFQQCLMIGLALSLLLVHEEIPQYTQQSFVELLCTADSTLSKNIIANLLQKYSLNNMVMETYFSQAKKVQSQFEINIINPNIERQIFNGLSNQCTKSSVNSVRTAEDEYLLENNLDSDSGSSFGSIQKIQNYPFQELKSLQISLKSNHKLVFCKLDVSKEQEEDFNAKMGTVRIISQFIKEQGISRSQLMNQNGEAILPKALKDLVGDSQMLLQYCQQMRNLLCLLAGQTIQFEQFLKMKYELDLQYQIYDQEVSQILYNLKANNKYVQNFCIIEGQILLIAMDKQYYAQVMVFLRKLFNQNKLSTCRYLTTLKKTDQDAVKYNDISEIMFTTMPSMGYAIYKPAQQEDFWI